MHAASEGRHFKITLLQERSAGTFARVYLAEASGSDGLSRIVAVKVLKEQWSESAELLDRTRDEARLLARLQHKNILRVEALAQIKDQPAIVMEFVDGVDLKQLVEVLHDRGDRIPPRATYRIAQHAASALEAAWAKIPYGLNEPLRVVHRDIKPSNIMLSIDGEVKVLDFGTARFSHEGRVAKTGVLRFGSMKYMSPERRTGDRGDHPCDIYALGLVIIEMLRGELLPLLPLDRHEHDETIAETIASLNDLGLPNAAWEDSLRQTLGRMCASDPTLRLSAGQVVELMRAFSEQGSGTSLDSFAASTVSQVASSLYGKDTRGALSGSQVFVAMTTSGSSPVQEAPLPEEVLPGPVSSVLPDPSASLVQPVERVRSTPTLQAIGPPPDRAPREPPPYRPPPPEPAERPPTPIAAPLPQPEPVYYEDEPEPSGRGGGAGRLIVIGALAAVVAALAVVAVAVLAIAIWLWVSRPTTPVANPVPPPPPDPVGSVAHDVQLRAGSDTVQWIRLEDSSGRRVLSGAPDGRAEVEEGTYELSVKVVARPTAKADLPVKGPLSLTCTPHKEQQVVCEGADAKVLLEP